MNKVINILAIIVGLSMALFGFNKFLNFIPMPELTPEQMEIFGAFGKIKWLMPLIGVGEVIGGILLAYPRTRALGANVLFPITLGILMHALVLDSSALPMAILYFGFTLLIIWLSKDRFMQLISK